MLWYKIRIDLAIFCDIVFMKFNTKHHTTKETMKTQYINNIISAFAFLGLSNCTSIVGTNNKVYSCPQKDFNKSCYKRQTKSLHPNKTIIPKASYKKAVPDTSSSKGGLIKTESSKKTIVPKITYNKPGSKTFSAKGGIISPVVPVCINNSSELLVVHPRGYEDQEQVHYNPIIIHQRQHCPPPYYRKRIIYRYQHCPPPPCYRKRIVRIAHCH